MCVPNTRTDSNILRVESKKGFGSMDTCPVELKHKQSVDAIRQKYGHNLSSHAFPSLYLWRDEMQLSLCLRENFFLV